MGYAAGLHKSETGDWLDKGRSKSEMTNCFAAWSVKQPTDIVW